MSITYNEILDSMKAAFHQEKGEPVADLSDLELRFKAVASEIYSVCAYGDYIFRQGFPQTATGAYLDKHAQLRSITRKKAARAGGELTFSLSEAASKSITIPAGTICSAAGKPFIQFATDKRAVISAGRLSVSVPATALRTGQEHNVEAGSVTDMVNPPDYVFSVTNDKAFTGGWNDESDEAFRERILSSYSNTKNAVSAEGVREILLSLDEITDACVFSNSSSSANVCLKTRNGRLSSSLKAKVSDLLGFLSFCSVEINFIAASVKEFSIKAEAKVLSGYDNDKIERAVRARIISLCSNEKIGQNYNEAAIAASCSDIEGIEYINVFFRCDGGIVSCGSTEFLRLTETEVYIHE